MNHLTDKIYANSPVWVQNLGITLYGMMWKERRFGGVFSRVLKEARERESWGVDQWKDYQTEKLRNLLVHAFKTVPAYKEMYSERKLDEVFFSQLMLTELKKLPILEKEVIRKDPLSFISSDCSQRKLHCYNTSGTTGTPLSIYFSSFGHQEMSAYYEARVRNWAGVNYRQRRAMIGGRLVVPRGISPPPYWRKNWAEGQLYMSAFHISPETARSYADALKRWKPDYLVGYASSWFFLSRFIVEQDLRTVIPQAVLTSSEKLTEEMRLTIEKAFKCPVYDGYSGVEACCLASECEKHKLHISPDVGIIELLDENGDPAPEGEPGEIVATGLVNFDQPLIRYKTGDYAVISSIQCSCGRKMPVLQELVGRMEDTVIGPDGRETVRFHGLFVGMKNIREGQVVQESLKKLQLRIVTGPEFSAEDEIELKRRVVERLGPVETVVENVEAIEKTERGKFRAVISKVGRRPS